MARRSAFICIEGLDGSGKTTQAKILAATLKKRFRYDAMYTREPSKGRIGKFLKKYCLDAESRESSIIEALLFAADRIHHLSSEVQPALERNRLVVSDRYVYSSLAYQGAAGLDLAWIREVNRLAIAPDLGVFIDVDPEAVFHRLKAKKSVMENLETQLKVREIYLKFVDSGELVKVDGNRTKKDVTEAILEVVLGFLRTT